LSEIEPLIFDFFPANSMTGGRGKSWSPEESLAACMAFTEASENPTKGVDQKIEAFTSDVQARWKEHCAAFREKGVVQLDGTWFHRSGRAVVQQYKKVKSDVLKLQSCLLRVQAWKPTGDLNDDDLIIMAIAVHNGEKIGPNLYAYVGKDAIQAPRCPYRKSWVWMQSQRMLQQVTAAAKTCEVKRTQVGSDNAEDSKLPPTKRIESRDFMVSPQ